MKAIICFNTGGVHMHSFTELWTPCMCGNVKAKWIDAEAGTVVVAARCQSTVRLLGMNNAYLIPAIQGNNGFGRLEWDDYRQLHDKAIDAPGYLFNKDKIACWAAVVQIGRSSDVRWATDEEYVEAFP